MKQDNNAGGPGIPQQFPGQGFQSFPQAGRTLKVPKVQVAEHFRDHQEEQEYAILSATGPELEDLRQQVNQVKPNQQQLQTGIVANQGKFSSKSSVSVGHQNTLKDTAAPKQASKAIHHKDIRPLKHSSQKKGLVYDNKKTSVAQELFKKPHQKYIGKKRNLSKQMAKNRTMKNRIHSLTKQNTFQTVINAESGSVDENGEQNNHMSSVPQSDQFQPLMDHLSIGQTMASQSLHQQETQQANIYHQQLAPIQNDQNRVINIEQGNFNNGVDMANIQNQINENTQMNSDVGMYHPTLGMTITSNQQFSQQDPQAQPSANPPKVQTISTNTNSGQQSPPHKKSNQLKGLMAAAYNHVAQQNKMNLHKKRNTNQMKPKNMQTRSEPPVNAEPSAIKPDQFYQISTEDDKRDLDNLFEIQNEDEEAQNMFSDSEYQQEFNTLGKLETRLDPEVQISTSNRRSRSLRGTRDQQKNKRQEKQRQIENENRLRTQAKYYKSAERATISQSQSQERSSFKKSLYEKRQSSHKRAAGVHVALNNVQNLRGESLSSNNTRTPLKRGSSQPYHNNQNFKLQQRVYGMHPQTSTATKNPTKKQFTNIKYHPQLNRPQTTNTVNPSMIKTDWSQQATGVLPSSSVSTKNKGAHIDSKSKGPTKLKSPSNCYEVQNNDFIQYEDKDQQMIKLIELENDNIAIKQRCTIFEEEIIKRIKDIQKYAKTLNQTVKKQVQPDIEKLMSMANLRDGKMLQQNFSSQYNEQFMSQEFLENQFNQCASFLDEQLQNFRDNTEQRLTNQDLQITLLSQQLVEKNDIIESIMIHQEQFQEFINDMPQKLRKEQNQKKLQGQFDDLKRQLTKQQEFQSNNITNLQYQIENQLQINSSNKDLDAKMEQCGQHIEQIRQECLQREHDCQEQVIMKVDTKMKLMTDQMKTWSNIYQSAIQTQQEQIDQFVGQDHQIQSRTDNNHGYRDQLEAMKVELQVNVQDQFENIMDRIQEIVQSGVTAEMRSIHQRQDREQNRNQRPQQQDHRQPRIPQQVVPNQLSQINNAENENMFDRSQSQRSDIVSASVRMAATEPEIQEDHPHLLAMQDSQIQGSFDNERHHQSLQNVAVLQNNNIMNNSNREENVDNQQQLHESHASEIDINVGAAQMQPDASLLDQAPTVGQQLQALQRLMQDVQQKQIRHDQQFASHNQIPAGFEQLHRSIEQLENRVLTDANIQAQSLEEIVEIKQKAQIIQNSLDQIQSRVQTIEENPLISENDEGDNTQINSATKNIQEKRLFKKLKEHMKPIAVQSEQNQFDLQTIQHLVGMIQDSNFQKQIDNLRRILNRYLRSNSQTSFRNEAEDISNQNIVIDQSPNATESNVAQSQRDLQQIAQQNQQQQQNNQIYENEEAKNQSEDIFMDRDRQNIHRSQNQRIRPAQQRMPHLESPQRMSQEQQAPYVEGDIILQNQNNRQLEISQDPIAPLILDNEMQEPPEEEQLYNSSENNNQQENQRPNDSYQPLDREPEMIQQENQQQSQVSLSAIQFDQNPEVGRDPLNLVDDDTNQQDASNYFSPVASGGNNIISQIPSCSPMDRRGPSHTSSLMAANNVIQYMDSDEQTPIDVQVDQIVSELLGNCLMGDLDELLSNVLSRDK